MRYSCDFNYFDFAPISNKSIVYFRFVSMIMDCIIFVYNKKKIKRRVVSV